LALSLLIFSPFALALALSVILSLAFVLAAPALPHALTVIV